MNKAIRSAMLTAKRVGRDLGGGAQIAQSPPPQIIKPQAPQIIKPQPQKVITSPPDLSGYQDAPAQQLHDMPWRPLADVHADLGHISEIPSHVQHFGRFMDESAEKAATKGLTPRDVIKAYAITRASMGRGALGRKKLEESGWHVPEGADSMRPEGAMGEWLHTPEGQDYLHHAERGHAHMPSIRHAVKMFTPFGKQNETEGKGLKWAAENLPGLEGHVSKMVQAMRHIDANPALWREFIKHVPGINVAKAGFFGSMMGMGNQPTLDARQIILNTGLATKDKLVKNAMSRVGGADAAVDRLAARQKALKLGIPEELLPYYQHLAHHAIWDQSAGEQTTHSDLIHAMRHANAGGRVGLKQGGIQPVREHEAAQAIQQAVAFDRAAHARSPEEAQHWVKNQPDIYSADPEKQAYARAIHASRYEMKPNFVKDRQSYFSHGYDQTPISEIHAKSIVGPRIGERGQEVVPKKPVGMSWPDFFKMAKGAHVVALGGDRSRLGTLTHINGQKLGWPVNLDAGHDYNLEGNKGAVWANAREEVKKYQKQIKSYADKGGLYGAFTPMGPKAADSSFHMWDALMSHVAGRGKLDEDLAKEIDDSIKSGMFEAVPKRKNAIKRMEGWPGINNPREARDFLEGAGKGAIRSLMVKHLDKSGWAKRGLPHVGHTRVAITHPDLLQTPGNTMGQRIVRLSPEDVESSDFGHGTYPVNVKGEYVGDFPAIERHKFMPDVVQNYAENPVGQKESVTSHPYSPVQGGRDAFEKMFHMQRPVQQVNPRMQESVMHAAENPPDYSQPQDPMVEQALKATRKAPGLAGRTPVQPPQQDDTVNKALRMTAPQPQV